MAAFLLEEKKKELRESVIRRNCDKLKYGILVNII